MLSQLVWLQQEYPVRQEIARIFHINRSSNVHVVDNRVQEDGYTLVDLADISLDKLQFYLNTTDPDYYKLFYTVRDMVVGSLNDGHRLKTVNERVDITNKEEHYAELGQPIPRRGRPKKQTKDDTIESA